VKIVHALKTAVKTADAKDAKIITAVIKEIAAGGNCCKDMKKSGGVSSDSAVCVVSGEPLVKGKEVVLNYLGKDYSFCCDNCVTSFKNEPIKYIKDGLMCPVMNEPVKNSVSTVYEGTKYYFCCKMCIKDFEADANKYLKKEPKTDNK
jgi:YHS domain-containing protein